MQLWLNPRIVCVAVRRFKSVHLALSGVHLEVTKYSGCRTIPALCANNTLCLFFCPRLRTILSFRLSVRALYFTLLLHHQFMMF